MSQSQNTTLVGNTEVVRMLGMGSVSGLNKLRVRDKTFPEPIKTSASRGARVRFDIAEVEAWISSKKSERGSAKRDAA